MTSLQSVLNLDGTLNMKSGFQGSLDARGWQMVSAPGMPPRFEPSDKGAGSPDAPSSPSSPAVPGDENWDGRFGPLNVNNNVLAVAVNGSCRGYLPHPCVSWMALQRMWHPIFFSRKRYLWPVG